MTHPPGHFYSPVADPAEVAEQAAQLWPERPDVLGIDFNEAGHLHVLQEVFPRFIGDYDYPEHGVADDDERLGFYTQNSQFSWLDSRALFVLLRHWQPARVIEVGSGYSSLLTADVNRRFQGGLMNVTCIEPYPRPFLERGVPGIGRVLRQKVQSVPHAFFRELGDGDILFIDSSHVAKIGSDVNYLFFEVLPRLRRGVRIHFHDIFLPHEYPRDWAIDENRSWNEQYLVRALLMDSRRYRVLFGCSYAYWRFPDKVAEALALPGGRALGGSSFWIQIDA